MSAVVNQRHGGLEIYSFAKGAALVWWCER
jgi:hypothetical protein